MFTLGWIFFKYQTDVFFSLSVSYCRFFLSTFDYIITFERCLTQNMFLSHNVSKPKEHWRKHFNFCSKMNEFTPSRLTLMNRGFFNRLCWSNLRAFCVNFTSGCKRKRAVSFSYQFLRAVYLATVHTFEMQDVNPTFLWSVWFVISSRNELICHYTHSAVKKTVKLIPIFLSFCVYLMLNCFRFLIQVLSDNFIFWNKKMMM